MSPHFSPGKRTISIYLPSQIIAESRRRGLNISRITLNALKETISKLSGTTEPVTESDGDGVVRPPGFEPGFLPYCCRSEAVRPVLAGLRRADACVPVLDQVIRTFSSFLDDLVL